MSEIETQAIERSTAEAFLHHYNAQERADYRVGGIAGPGQSPDVQCVNSAGAHLWLEITTTEDNPGDTKALLGRSNHKSRDALRGILRDTKKGEEKLRINRLSGNVANVLIGRLRRKFRKRYGSPVALVVRETSGVPWDWDTVLPLLRDTFSGTSIPFDRGVWILSRDKNRLTRLF